MVSGINENIFLVNAPAGSGKTTTIKKMVEAHLRLHPSDNVLCITYTNRAAEELGKDMDYDNVFFGTIHSFINSFIKSFFSHREVLDLYWDLYKDKIQARIENVEEKPNVTESNQRYIEKYGGISTDIVYANLKEISYSETPYTSLLRGSLSHDELITFTRALFDKFGVIRKKIADKYQLIFIDEYQDTSADVLHIFYEAMKGSKGKLYLLGDKMQQIYSTYDGTFEQEFETMDHSFNLERNYRTTPYIVSVLNKIYNDERYKQLPYEENKDEDMDYYPEVIFTKEPVEVLEAKRQQYPNALVLYLLNKDRFAAIGTTALYEAVQGMESYSFGRKYTVVDVLTKNDATNPDKLFSLLFLLREISEDFDKKIYGKLIRTLKQNKNVFNTSKYTIRQHADKKVVGDLLKAVVEKFHMSDVSINDFLMFLKEMEMVNQEYIEEIMGDVEYEKVLNVLLKEFNALCDYLANPHISTQHGVKGESHQTVFFVAADSVRSPYVSMSKFFKLWSMAEVDLSSFDKFYYDYKNMICSVEQLTGVKGSQMKKADYTPVADKVLSCLSEFAKSNEENVYFKCLLKAYFDKCFAKPEAVSNVTPCLKENSVYGVLSAYRLFYVGCSRARKNLTIIINLDDVQGFEEGIKDKFKGCGFQVK